jgi:hypothetical protein
MTREKFILAGLAVAVAASSALGTSPRYPISKQQVAAAVSNMGVDVAPEQVTLLADVVATTGAPRLTVRSMQRWGNQKMVARLECESSDQCLPFLVSLKMNPGEDTGSVPPQGYVPIVSTSAAKHFVVKSGTPATLMLEGQRVHIRLNVICLESGATGQTIRVTDRDHKVVYHAQVVDGGLLQGRL